MSSMLRDLRARGARAWGGRCTDDHGAVLVEAALITPLLVVILAGTFDFGVAFRNRITMQGGVRNAARAAAVLGPNASADQFALSTLAAGTTGLESTVLNRAVIFHTTSAGAISSGCATTISPTSSGAGSTSAGAECNIYGPSQMANLATFAFTNSTCSTGWDRYYCPKNRSNSLVTASGPDYLGVYMSVTYTPFTKIFKTSFTLTDKSVIRLEPAAA